MSLVNIGGCKFKFCTVVVVVVGWKDVVVVVVLVCNGVFTVVALPLDIIMGGRIGVVVELSICCCCALLVVGGVGEGAVLRMGVLLIFIVDAL